MDSQVVVRPSAFLASSDLLLLGMFVKLISVIGLFNPRAIVRLE
jgi:hypothetical protein